MHTIDLPQWRKSFFTIFQKWLGDEVVFIPAFVVILKWTAMKLEQRKIK